MKLCIFVKFNRVKVSLKEINNGVTPEHFLGKFHYWGKFAKRAPCQFPKTACNQDQTPYGTCYRFLILESETQAGVVTLF